LISITSAIESAIVIISISGWFRNNLFDNWNNLFSFEEIYFYNSALQSSTMKFLLSFGSIALCSIGNNTLFLGLSSVSIFDLTVFNCAIGNGEFSKILVCDFGVKIVNLESFFICNQGGGCFLGNFFRIGLAIVVAAAIVIVIPRTTIVCSASWGASSSDEFFIYIS